jgi:hypothetical protein
MTKGTFGISFTSPFQGLKKYTDSGIGLYPMLINLALSGQNNPLNLLIYSSEYKYT